LPFVFPFVGPFRPALFFVTRAFANAQFFSFIS
jgi:hypothetical protein